VTALVRKMVDNLELGLMLGNNKFY